MSPVQLRKDTSCPASTSTGYDVTLGVHEYCPHRSKVHPRRRPEPVPFIGCPRASPRSQSGDDEALLPDVPRRLLATIRARGQTRSIRTRSLQNPDVKLKHVRLVERGFGRGCDRGVSIAHNLPCDCKAEPEAPYTPWRTGHPLLRSAVLPACSRRSWLTAASCSVAKQKVGPLPCHRKPLRIYMPGLAPRCTATAVHDTCG